MALAITLISSGGLPVVEASNGYGIAVDRVATGGIPCTLVTDFGMAIVSVSGVSPGGSAGQSMGLLLALTYAS